MRLAWMAAAAAAMCSSSASVAAAADYYLKIQAVAPWSGTGPIHLKVQSTGDLDGDGVADAGTLRLHCTGGFLRSASFRAASYERPVAWAAPTEELARKAGIGYDLAPAKAARAGAAGAWVPIRLSNTQGLCPAAMKAVLAGNKASRSRSVIQNN